MKGYINEKRHVFLDICFNLLTSASGGYIYIYIKKERIRRIASSLDHSFLKIWESGKGDGGIKWIISWIFFLVFLIPIMVPTDMNIYFSFPSLWKELMIGNEHLLKVVQWTFLYKIKNRLLKTSIIDLFWLRTSIKIVLHRRFAIRVVI